MLDADLPFRPEALLEQRAFLRALAKSLLADEHEAEDVVQDACIAALEQPPRSGEALRAWLARVTRNLSLNALRERERRARREEHVARSESSPNEEHVDARLHAQRRVAAAVLALREPYKSAIWMRWYEGLPPREIARRLGVPIETVKSRLKRAQSELKIALDREFGDRSSWCSALAMLAVRDTAIVATPVFVACVGAALLIGVAVWNARASPRVTSIVAERERPIDVEWNAPTPAAAAVVVHSTGNEIATSARREPLTQAAAASAPLRGRALDARTREIIPNLIVRSIVEGDHVRTLETDANGEFRLENARSFDFRIAANDVDDPLEIVARETLAARGSELSIDVFDVAIGPTYTLALEPPNGLSAADFTATLETTETSGGRAEDVAISAPAPTAPVHAGTNPWVRLAESPRPSLLRESGRSTYRLRVASRDGMWSATSFVLARDGAYPTLVECALVPCAVAQGRVLARDGAPIAGARVTIANALGARATRTAIDGRWKLGTLVPGAARVRVSSPAYQSTELECALIALDARALETRLERRVTTSVSGRLHSRTGTHVPSGALVLRASDDPTIVLETHSELKSPSKPRVDAFELADVPPGEYELLPPMGDAWAWDPPLARITVPCAPIDFTCNDDVPAVTVALRAVDLETGIPMQHFRAAILLDRYALGRRAAVALEPHACGGETRAGEVLFDSIPRDMRGWWLVECDGHASAWGELSDLRRTRDRIEGEARLASAFTCRLWVGAASDDGRALPLGDARILTSGRKLLATSLASGDALVDLLYEPGRLSIELDGWRVKSWEGFARGKRQSQLDVHRVWMERAR